MKIDGFQEVCNEKLMTFRSPAAPDPAWRRWERPKSQIFDKPNDLIRQMVLKELQRSSSRAVHLQVRKDLLLGEVDLVTHFIPRIFFRSLVLL